MIAINFQNSLFTYIFFLNPYKLDFQARAWRGVRFDLGPSGDSYSDHPQPILSVEAPRTSLVYREWCAGPQSVLAVLIHSLSEPSRSGMSRFAAFVPSPGIGLLLRLRALCPGLSLPFAVFLGGPPVAPCQL
jgi:hypothetical protein